MRTAAAVGLVVLIATGVVPVAIHGQSTPTTGDGERPIDIDTDRLNVYLQAQQTEIDHDQSVILVHSATNYITNAKPLTVQLLLEAPSGADVFGSSGVESGSGSQFSTVTTLGPGEQESLRIHAEFHDPGEYEITAQAIYYFGENRSGGDGVEVTIPIEQRPPPPSTSERVVRTATESLGVYGSLVNILESPLPPPERSQAPAFLVAPWLFMIAGYVAGAYVLALLAAVLLFSYAGMLRLTSSTDDMETENELALLVTVGAVILAVLDLLSVFGSGDVTLLTARLLAGLLLVIGALVVLFVASFPLMYVWVRIAHWLKNRGSDTTRRA